MAESRESSDVDKSKTDFLSRVKTVKSEIRTKFLNLRKDLDDQELRTLEKVEKIEREILEKCERASASLKEISQVRDGILTGLKSNSANYLLKKSLEMYDKEIEHIKLYSKIDSTIELVWKLEQLPSICEVSSIEGPSSQVSRNSDIHTPSSKTSGLPKKRSASSSKVDSTPPVKIVKISRPLTKKMSIRSPPKKSIYEILFSDSDSTPARDPEPDYESDSTIVLDPESDYESTPTKTLRDFESDSECTPARDSEPDYESDSTSIPDPESDYESDSTPIPDPRPDYESDSTPIPDPEPDYETDSTPIPDPEPDYETDSTPIPDPEPDYESDSESTPARDPDSYSDSD